MSVYLHYPDLNIEISDQSGCIKVRDLSTGEERQLATCSAELNDHNNVYKNEREQFAEELDAQQEPDAQQALDFT